MADLILGQVLSFAGDAMVEGAGAARHLSQGGVLVDAGRIVAVGEAAVLRAAYPAVPV